MWRTVTLICRSNYAYTFKKDKYEAICGKTPKKRRDDVTEVHLYIYALLNLSDWKHLSACIQATFVDDSVVSTFVCC